MEKLKKLKLRDVKMMTDQEMKFITGGVGSGTGSGFGSGAGSGNGSGVVCGTDLVTCGGRCSHTANGVTVYGKCEIQDTISFGEQCVCNIAS